MARPHFSSGYCAIRVEYSFVELDRTLLKGAFHDSRKFNVTQLRYSRIAHGNMVSPAAENYGK